MQRIAGFIGTLISVLLVSGANAADIDWSKVDQAIGKPGTNQPGGVHKFGLPRSDLKVTMDGVAIKPTLALGSWIGFMPMGTGAMFMGDLVLTENEIEPVMKRPHLFFMHFWANDDLAKLTRGLRSALDLASIKRGT
jgi:Domain of Unknown Function (DUF1259)